ncbi:MAG TPA: PQQ-dependent sugar dehydrogenase [Pyrinomonadaceae bacterium]|jgi:glucose/arabinose dehydrogenase
MRLSLSVGVPFVYGAGGAMSAWRKCVCAWAGLLLLALACGAATLPSGFTETQITGLVNPTAMAFAPDGRLFVCQQGGALRVIKNGALLPTPFMTLTVNSAGERGLLGIAFDPNFAANNFIYVYYTATTPAIHNRVSRFTANGDVVVPGSELVILDLNNLSSATNHNGGAMHFGPDGKLYLAVGENANPANAQSFANLLGKMLRINTNPASVIPTDNPYFNDANVTGNNKAIWALGLRNPYTFAFQASTGRMFINDVGQNTYEEINEGVAHSNYGWSVCEGFVCSSTAPVDYRAPLYVYAHTTGTPTGCAIVGGTFYDPPTAQFPATYVGRYFFADLCGGYIRYVEPGTGGTISSSTSFATGISSPVDLKVASDGSLWYLAGAGGGAGLVARIQFPAGQVPPTIMQQPASQTVGVGQTATFRVSADGATPLQFQWQRNNVDIAGATAATYTTPPATTADNGAQFRVIVTNAFGSVTSNSATLTVTQNAPPTGDVLISEFRLRGPAGDADEFVELYNNTNADITVSAADGSGGWAVAAPGLALVTIPNNTVLKARAHFLVVNSTSGTGYSLANYGGAGAGGGNASFTPGADIPADAGVALFSTAKPANFTLATRLDAVGFSAVSNALYREGAGLQTPAGGITPGVEHSFVRRLTTGTPQDTGDNAQDFVLVAPDPAAVTNAAAQLGAPGPENAASPIQRNAQIKSSLIEPQQLSTAPPNRLRDTTPVANGAEGTLEIRRRFKNSTGQSISRLRFRVVDITTLSTPNPGGAQADLRLLTSNDLNVTTSLGALTVKGTIVEAPPNQPGGGGLNTTVNVPGGVANGATVDVRFVLGVQTNGRFRFLVNVEAVTGTPGLLKGGMTRAPLNNSGSVCSCKVPGKM